MIKLGLTLGGGGARGSAHIGVLQELEDLGLRPDLVTGTSIGGLIGAFYCAGMSLEQIETALRRFKPSSMYALPDNEPAIGSHTNIDKALQRIFADYYGDQFADREIKRPQFSDLEIPLAVVATDLVTKREVILDSGDLILAVRASLSIPILFPPIAIGDWQLVDGGMMNNVPFDVARARGATHTIAVDLGSAAPYGTPPEHTLPQPDGNNIGVRLAQMLDRSVFDRAIYQVTREPIWQVVTTIMDIVADNTVKLRVAMSPPDVLIRPHLGTIGILDFHTIDEGMEAGRLATRRSAKGLERLLTRRIEAKQPELTEKD
ncbi:MAG: patatin-like phospholipase family protein [Chloroflexota bacterium]